MLFLDAADRQRSHDRRGTPATGDLCDLVQVRTGALLPFTPITCRFSDVELEVQDVAVLDHIFLAFLA